MQITESTIREHLQFAEEIVEECCPKFSRPDSYKIGISTGRSFWATVTKDRNYPLNVRLKVTKVFEEIPDEALAEQRLTGCMIHELLHTIPGCMNHGKNWKAQAQRINSKYPYYDVQRCTSMTDYGIDKQKDIRPDKYRVKCATCGKEWKYKKKPNVWHVVNKGHSSYRCPHCSGDVFVGELINA